MDSDILKCYIIKRIILVKFEDEYSETKPINAGVPQDRVYLDRFFTNSTPEICQLQTTSRYFRKVVTSKKRLLKHGELWLVQLLGLANCDLNGVSKNHTIC